MFYTHSTSEALHHGSVEEKVGKSTHLTPRLPLPESVKEMFRESEEQWTDKSEEHGGRLRSFQHERGNWATYVFFPCKSFACVSFTLGINMKFTQTNHKWLIQV